MNLHSILRGAVQRSVMSGRHTNIAEGALNTSSNSDGGDRRGVGAARTAYFFVAILVGLGVIVVFSVFFHPSPHGPISLTFTGFVNVRPSSDAPAGKLAVFLFTNGAPTRICYFVESIEHQTTNGWFTNTLHRTPKEWRDFGVELGPFESRILHVPPPTNGVEHGA